MLKTTPIRVRFYFRKIYGAYFDADNLYEQLYSKHFKKFYDGKPTKRYLKIMKQINKAERFTSAKNKID